MLSNPNGPVCTPTLRGLFFYTLKPQDGNLKTEITCTDWSTPAGAPVLPFS